jgi:hypothetical protein
MCDVLSLESHAEYQTGLIIGIRKCKLMLVDACCVAVGQQLELSQG